MTETADELITYELTTPQAIEEAQTDLVNRCHSLPPGKQHFLANIFRNNDISIETISILVLMVENSDDDGNITSPALNHLIEEAQARHR